jgi:uncharacterized membrane protein YbhN (UPF0104 family)
MRQVVAHALLALAAIGLLYVVLPRLTGVRHAWGRMLDGDAWWLWLALAFEIASYAGYVIVFRAVFDSRATGVGWRLSATITLAGVAASRLLSAAGAGGSH